MNSFSEEKQKLILKKLVSNAKAIISNQIGFLAGCLKMNKSLFGLKPYQVIEIQVFNSYFKETIDIPIGSERPHCSRDAIKSYDEKLIQIELSYREKVIDVCFEIIRDYGEK